MTAYSCIHTATGRFPSWYHLSSHPTLDAAIRCAQDFVMRRGGYICVRDASGRSVYGTDPAELDRAVVNGTNRDFPSETARLAGCCVS